MPTYNRIVIFEHQIIRVGEQNFTKAHLKLLEKFRGDYEDEKFNYYSLIHNGVKFKHYVGVLNVGGLQIEVLPKTDNSIANENKWRGHLLKMLNAVYKLQTDAPSNALQQLKDSSVLDVFLQRFLDEVDKLLHIGLIKTYRKEKGNRNALKGKIVWNKHLAKNMVHPERFYVNYTTYDQNHIMNRILYKTLLTIPNVTQNSDIVNKAKGLAFEFPELMDITVTDNIFTAMHFDRKSDGYQNAIGISKLILLNYMPDGQVPQNNVLALMFDMNKLWEEYIYVVLKRKLSNKVVRAQEGKQFWERKTIEPDIVIYDQSGKKPLLVIDTKWKCPIDSSPNDADLKQMFVYHLYWHVSNTVLLYPDIGRQPFSGKFQKTSNQIDFSGLTCHMMYFPIDI